MKTFSQTSQPKKSPTRFIRHNNMTSMGNLQSTKDITKIDNFQNKSNTFSSDPKTTNESNDTNQDLDDTTRLEIENYFDELIEKLSVLPFHQSTEPILTSIYTSYKSLIWIPKDNQFQSYFSPTLNKELIGEDTLVSMAARAKTSIICPASIETFDDQQYEDEFDQLEAESAKLFFPFYLKSGNIIAVAEIIRAQSQDPFNDHDLKISSLLMRKFLLYGSAMFHSSETVLFASDFAHITNSNDLNQRLSNSLIEGFKCKLADFWCLNHATGEILKFDGEFIQPPRSHIGIVIAALRNKSTLNFKTPRYHHNFSFNADLLPDEPVLISTCDLEDCTFAAALRGRTLPNPFSADEASKFEAVMPFIARSLLYSTNLTQGAIQKNPYESQLIQLLNISSLLTKQLTLNELITAIEESSMKLTKCKSCKFILYQSNNTVFRVISENNKIIEFSSSSGLHGSVMHGSTIRIDAPKLDQKYDEKIDLMLHKPNNEIHSLLVVPVYSSSQDIIGLISLANKNKNKDFTEDDERLIETLSIFVSLAYQNVTILQSSLQLTNNLNNLVLSKHSNKKLHVEDSLLIQIMKQSRDEINADRISVFLANNDDLLLLYRTIGAPLENGTNYSIQSQKEKKMMTFCLNNDLTERETQKKSLLKPSTVFSNRPQRSIELSTSSNNSEIPNNQSQNKVDMGTSPSSNDTGRLIICNPIFLDNELMGIIEVSLNLPSSEEEIEIIKNFTNMINLTISTKAIQQLKTIRDEQFALCETITEEERDLMSIPSKLKENITDNLFTNDFDVNSIDSQYLLNIAFAIFNKFGLMHEFKITTSKLFLFLYKLQNLYTEETWRHSVEVSSFLSFILIITRLDEQLSKSELISLIIASLCHDLDKTSCSTKSDVAFDVLYSKQPVHEGRSCEMILTILSSSDINILDSLSNIDDTVDLIINLIISTNYYQHHQLIHELKILASNDGFTLEDEKSKLTIMQAFLNCSLIGVIGRPPEVADQYEETICEDYFDKGPYDKLKDVVYKSGLANERSTIERKESRKSVLYEVYAPLFQLILKIFPQFEIITTNMTKNIIRWVGNDPAQPTTPNKTQSQITSEMVSEAATNNTSDASTAPQQNETNQIEEEQLGPDRMFEND